MVNDKIKAQIDHYENEIKNLKQQIEAEQYSRRNCLVIHGIASKREENTDEVVKTFISQQLEFEIDEKEIDRSHRLPTKGKPLKVKFVQHNTESKI